MGQQILRPVWNFALSAIALLRCLQSLPNSSTNFERTFFWSCCCNLTAPMAPKHAQPLLGRAMRQFAISVVVVGQGLYEHISLEFGGRWRTQSGAGGRRANYARSGFAGDCLKAHPASALLFRPTQ